MLSSLDRSLEKSYRTFAVGFFGAAAGGTGGGGGGARTEDCDGSRLCDVAAAATTAGCGTTRC